MGKAGAGRVGHGGWGVGEGIDGHFGSERDKGVQAKDYCRDGAGYLMSLCGVTCVCYHTLCSSEILGTAAGHLPAP